jgi:hypothetical protein
MGIISADVVQNTSTPKHAAKIQPPARPGARADLTGTRAPEKFPFIESQLN